MITAGDFLAGGGGVTTAMYKINGLKVKFVLNHDRTAINTNMFNNRGIKHYLADLYKQDEHELEQVDFAWASLACQEHTPAKGLKKKKTQSYALGWEFFRYVKYLMPYVIGIENVPGFKKWAPLDDDDCPIKSKKGEEFIRWRDAICALGYDYHEKIMNAADYGIPTRRIRYFAFFTRIELGMIILWPAQTHNKNGTHGLKKYVACKHFIDLEYVGESIFGREFNTNIKKQHRHPLSPNSLERFAGGIDKFAPEMQYIFQYYGSGINGNSINSPLNTITTKDRHALLTLEKMQFIADHCHSDNFNLPEDPLNPILTRQTKQLVTVEKKKIVNQHISSQYNSNGNPSANNTSLDAPLNTITVCGKHQLISHHFGSGVNQSIDEPINAITTKEKIQFITAYYTSSGKQRSQNQKLDAPLGAITTGTNKQALTSLILNGEIDFDIKMRFLDPEELSLISTFPAGYFTNKDLKLSRKMQTKLIGNAVPPDWAKLLIEPVVRELEDILNCKKVAI